MHRYVAVLLLALAACRYTRVPSQGTVEDIRHFVALGEVAQAGRMLEAIGPESADWPPVRRWQVRLLRAEIAVLKRDATEALMLLSDPPPSELATGEIAIRRLMLQASASTTLNDTARASEMLRAAADLADRNGSADLQADIEQRFALVALAQQRAAEAAQHLKRGLELARSAGDKRLEAQMLANRGVLEARQGRFTDGITSLESALAIANQIGMRSGAGKILGNLGWCYRVIGDLEKAEEDLRQAVRLAEEHGITGDQQGWLVNLGNVEFERGRLAEAQTYYRRAEAIPSQGFIGPVYNNLALVALELGQMDVAEKYSAKAADVNANAPSSESFLRTRLMAAAIARRQGRAAEAEAKLTALIADSAAELTVLAEAHAELARLYRQTGALDPVRREYNRAMDAVVRARMNIVRDEHKLAFLSARARFLQEYVQFLMQEGRAREALAVVEFMRTRSLEERLGGAISNRLPSASTIRAPGRKTVALVYWLSEPKSYLWCVTGDRVEHYELPARKQIETQVADYRRVLLSPLFDEESARRRGQALYATVIGPAQHRLRYGLRLAVVPDGALHRLDFGSLAMPGDELRYLIEEMAVVHMPALTLPAAGGGAAPTRLLLTLGNAETDGVSVPALPRSGGEMRAVASHFDAARTLLVERASAVPSAYAASHPDTFRFIHLAAHGTGNTVNPLESALLLSPEGNGYRLYARDILETPIHAELVTVSACHGSGGRAYDGEGLVGLAWAFLRAGARNVIAALTEVSDTATPRLMDRLYSELASGKDPASALQAAKIELLRSGTIYRRPQYWAPFVVYSRE